MILKHVFSLDYPKFVDHIFYGIIVTTIEMNHVSVNILRYVNMMNKTLLNIVQMLFLSHRPLPLNSS